MSTLNRQQLNVFQKNQQKQIFRRLIQLKNKYLLESFWGLIVNVLKKDPDCQWQNLE
jgi:hypothetical protein